MELVAATRQNDVVKTRKEVNIEEVVTAFIASQDVKESSKMLYKRTLSQFFGWVEATRLNLDSLERSHVLQYKKSLLDDGKSVLTANSYITAVRKFYEWAEASKLYPNIAKGVKGAKKRNQFKKQPLRPEQASAMLEKEAAQSIRDFALINLLLRTGLRTIEVSRANVEDITYIGGQLVLMVQGKGRDEKDNFVILTKKTAEPLQEYLNSRRASQSEPLFASESNNSKGGRMTTRTISHIAKEAMKSIGLESRAYTAHSLRHTAAVNILRAGGTLEMVQMTLRHANPATTQIYTKFADEERRLAANGESLLDTIY